MARKTNLQRGWKYEALIRGVKKRWSASAPRSIGGKAYSSEEIVARLRSMLDSMRETSATYAAWRAQVAKQRILERRLRDFVRFLEIHVRAEFGERPTFLTDFGLEPSRKTGPRTVTAKVEMVKKATATRIERATKGKRQRLKIKGKP